MVKLRYKKIVKKVLSDKKKLLDEANSCNFFALYKDNQNMAYQRLYQCLNLNFNYISKFEKRAIKEKFRKALFQLRNGVSLLSNSFNNWQCDC